MRTNDFEYERFWIFLQRRPLKRPVVWNNNLMKYIDFYALYFDIFTSLNFRKNIHTLV